MKRLIFERLTDPVAPLPIVKDERTRIRDHLRLTGGFDDPFIDQLLRGYDTVETAKRHLGIK
jgi:hypothetical protein